MNRFLEKLKRKFQMGKAGYTFTYDDDNDDDEDTDRFCRKFVREGSKPMRKIRFRPF